MEAYTDALFEERRGRLEIREPTDLVCGSQNKITKMCVKPSCPRRSLFCNKRNCYSCRKYDHQKCPQVCLKDITQDLNSHIPARQYMIEQVGEIEKKVGQKVEKYEKQCKGIDIKVKSQSHQPNHSLNTSYSRTLNLKSPANIRYVLPFIYSRLSPPKSGRL